MQKATAELQRCRGSATIMSVYYSAEPALLQHGCLFKVCSTLLGVLTGLPLAPSPRMWGPWPCAIRTLRIVQRQVPFLSQWNRHQQCLQRTQHLPGHDPRRPVLLTSYNHWRQTAADTQHGIVSLVHDQSPYSKGETGARHCYIGTVTSTVTRHSLTQDGVDRVRQEALSRYLDCNRELFIDSFRG